MMLELSVMNLIFIVIALFSGLWALLKAMAVMFTRAQQKLMDDLKNRDRLQHGLLDERLDALQRMLSEDASQWHRIEREMLSLKAELPVLYVRRDDYIRGQSTLEAKMDGLGMRLENMQLRALKNVN